MPPSIMEDFYPDTTVTRRADLSAKTGSGLDLITKPTNVPTTRNPSEKFNNFIRQSTLPHFCLRQRSVRDVLHEANSIVQRGSPKLQSPTRRRVTFDGSVKTELLDNVLPASLMNDKEKSRLWWGTKELEEFTTLAETRIKTLVQYRPSVKAGSSTTYHVLLARIYEACCCCCCCNAKDDQTVMDLLRQGEDFQLLVQAFRNSKGNRGLEAQMLKMMSSSSRELPAIPSMAIHAVLTLQSNRQILATTKALSIGHCSERITRPSRVFAQVLAHADAECIRCSNELNHLRKNGVPPRQRSMEDIDPRKREKRRRGSLLALML